MTTRKAARHGTPAASSIDVRRILGELGDAEVAEILALEPTLAELEDAAAYLAGDQDVVAKAGHHPGPTVARIVEMLEVEEDEPDK